MTQKRRTHFHHLKNKWLKKHHDLQLRLWTKHKDSLEWAQNSVKHAATVSSLASLLMLAQPNASSVLAQQFLLPPGQILEHSIDGKTHLLTELSLILPQTVEPLTEQQERTIADILTRRFNIVIEPSLDGKRLNRSYGYIGAEQHLMRYPGDTIATHFQTADEFSFAASGMAPGRGAWGYFTPSAEMLAQRDIEREKYYIAVQTFLSPGWNENVNEMYNFFKYRKMLVVNPDNGKSMVVVIGDAGPGQNTGKHLGGSPEVMRYLERKDGGAKGPVLYFFIDDPQDRIPLGPITTEKL